MSEIMQKTRKVFSGLDADKTAVTGMFIGDRYFSTDIPAQYHYTGAAWVRDLVFVERLVTGTDFTVANFITDGNAHPDGLNLASIVPAGAKAVKLLLIINDDAIGTFLHIYRDAAHGLNTAAVTVYNANVESRAIQDVAIDNDRLMDYITMNTSIAFIWVVVLGWYI